METTPSKLNLRLPAPLRAEIQRQADALGVSLNAYCLLALDNFTRSRRPPKSTPAAPVMTTTRPPQTLPKVGRNDPCSCGSGKKAKLCCQR